jgi:prepilin-type N-terminal cleavage/methylation domain-containing protein
MMKTNFNNLASTSKQGFSLVEMIVYISVLTIVALASVSSLLMLSDLFTKYRAEQIMFRSASSALELMVRDIKEADSVTSFSNQIDGSLTLSGPQGTVTYATSSDNLLHLTINGVDQGALLDDRVVVNRLSFFSGSDVTEYARVIMVLESTIGDTSVIRTFRSGAVLRGSYE